jgi:hypothetical protein
MNLNPVGVPLADIEWASRRAKRAVAGLIQGVADISTENVARQRRVLRLCLLFGRSNAGEHREQHKVVRTFEYAGNDQRPAERRQGEQIAGG